MNAISATVVMVVLAVAAGGANAQRATVVGVKERRDKVTAYADAEGKTRLDPVLPAQLIHRPSVLETSVDESLVRVRIGEREVWLDRNALQLGADVNAACHEVTSAHGAPPPGAARGANSACPLNIRTGGK